MGLPWDDLEPSTGVPQLLASDCASPISGVQPCADNNNLRPLQGEIRYNFDHVNSNSPSKDPAPMISLAFPLLPLSSG